MRSSLLLIGLLLTTACAPIYRLTLPGSPHAGGQLETPNAGASGCPPAGDWRPADAIRSPDANVRYLLSEGCRLSPSLQQLAAAIARTDGVVYVSIGSCPVRALRGCLLHSVYDAVAARYLWIRVSPNSDSRELLATVAHELQHALEVLARDNIRTSRDLLDFYRSQESRSYSGAVALGPFRTYETIAAINVGDAVRAELTASSSAAAVAADERD